MKDIRESTEASADKTVGNGEIYLFCAVDEELIKECVERVVVEYGDVITGS